MSMKKPTIYEEVRAAGYSRRDFLKFCGTMAAMLGLEASGVAQVAKALETNLYSSPLLWIRHFFSSASKVTVELSPCPVSSR